LSRTSEGYVLLPGAAKHISGDNRTILRQLERDRSRRINSGLVAVGEMLSNSIVPTSMMAQIPGPFDRSLQHCGFFSGFLYLPTLRRGVRLPLPIGCQPSIFL
jgi:hypothetical protein